MKIIKNLTFAALAATLLFQTSITRADDNALEHRNATVTWTKWITERITPSVENGMLFATIAGDAGGDIGVGTVTGEAFNIVSPGVFEAFYHFVGSKHSLTVHFNIVQISINGVVSGVVTGVVTEGWLKGNVVVGDYTGRACNDEEGLGLSLCFDGTAEILRGSKNKD